MFLDVDQLCVSYPKRANPSVDRVTLGLHAGQMGVLIGSSGCGKTSLLRAVAGLEQASAGEIRLAQSVVSSANEHVAPEARQIGMVFQDFALFPHLTVLENVIFGLREGSISARKQTGMQWLERVSLQDKAAAYPHELSGGQQQRVAIIRSLAINPRLLLLDEITSALDPVLVNEVLSIVRDLKQDGMTMVLATHEMGFATQVADEVCFLESGNILERGSAEQVLKNPTNQKTQEFLKRVHQAGRL